MLNTKQIKKLKSIAMTEKSIFQIGKDNLSDNLIDGLNKALEAHELVKITVLKNSNEDVKELANEVTKATNSELVQIIGRRIVIYKKSKKNLIQI